MSRKFAVAIHIVGSLAVGLALPLLVNAQTGFLDRSVTVGVETYRYQVYVPREFSRDKKWPVILSLHHAGVRGSDGIRPTADFVGMAIRAHRDWLPPTIAVFPQARSGHLWDGEMQAQALSALDAATREFQGDPDRTYLVGFSMGGRGAWSLASKQPNRFAALVVIAGPVVYFPSGRTASEQETAVRENAFPRSQDPFSALASTIKHIPIWIGHGSNDTVAPLEESRRMAETLRKLNAAVTFRELTNVGHDPTPLATEPALWSWLFAQSRSKGSR